MAKNLTINEVKVWNVLQQLNNNPSEGDKIRIIAQLIKGN